MVLIIAALVVVDPWVLMGIDLWVLIGLMVAEILMGGLIMEVGY